MPPIISVRDVCKSFEKDGKVVEVLRGITFDVERGETLCILGGSGGGKSTLLKVMIGATPPTDGEIIIDGENIVDMSERQMQAVRRKFGVLFQSGALLNSMTVAQNVSLPISMHTKQAAETIDLIVKLKLNQVGLSHAYGRLPSEISGGMQKRAGLARAIALDPKIVFYDEPSAGLDPQATTAIDELINSMKSEMRITNIVVTHVMESVRRIADHIVMLDKGKVLLDGSLDDFLEETNPKIVAFREGQTDALAGDPETFKRFVSDLLM